jgi:hypothetical protein
VLLRVLGAFLVSPGMVARMIPAIIGMRELNTGGLAVTMMLADWAAGFCSPTVAIHTGSVIVGFHLRVVFGEDPWLARTHDAAQDEYKRKVPRWLP